MNFKNNLQTINFHYETNLNIHQTKFFRLDVNFIFNQEKINRRKIDKI